VFRPLKPTRIVPWMRQGLVQIPKGEAHSASFSEDYVAAPRHIILSMIDDVARLPEAQPPASADRVLTRLASWRTIKVMPTTTSQIAQAR
jgi:hypothetical protein